MKCPVCKGATHVVETRASDAVKRVRLCGQMQNGKLVGKSCGLRFTTVELPTGVTATVQVRVTPKGLRAEIVKGRKQ